MDIFTDGTDTVIAESKEDAVKVWEETTGEKRSDYYDDELAEWELVSPEKELTIVYEDDPKRYPDKLPKNAKVHQKEPYLWAVTAKGSEWIEESGRGFLCSTEW